ASWTALGEHVPMGCTLTRHEMHVDSLAPEGAQWLVNGTAFDEVLLATGHAHDWPGALSAEDLPEGVRLIRSPYPPHNLDGIGPEDRVLVRGAALTFIDIIRACDPAVFIPVTRTGQLMTVKPDLGDLDATEILEEGKRRILEVAD